MSLLSFVLVQQQYVHLASILFLSLFAALIYSKKTSIDINNNKRHCAVEVKLDGLGRVRGCGHQLECAGHNRNCTIAAFLGIPFAQPPLGSALRFEKPKPVRKWRGVLMADKQKPACIYHARPDGLGSGKKSYAEDCLYLNIFAPMDGLNANGDAKSPVLVVIHGGGFELGSTHPYNDPNDVGTKFISQGIVVVTVEYRLGWIGFGSTGNGSGMPGNLGLWDQLVALEFLHAHVHAFGGDPERITLYGYSAGSASISLLGISPHSQNLFQQGIQMSGSPFAAWALNERSVNETMELARELQCFDANSKHKGMRAGEEAGGVKECMAGKAVAEIWSAVDRIGSTRPDDVNFAKWCPRVDGDFLPADLPELIQNAKPKPTVMGFVDLESLLWTLFSGTNNTLAAYAIPWSELRKYDRHRFEQSVRMLVAKPQLFGNERMADEVQRAIVDFYLDEADPLREFGRLHGLYFPHYLLQRYTLLLSDLQFILPILMELHWKTAHNGWPNIYLYQNVHNNPAEFSPPVKVHQNFHTNDLNLLFSESHFPFDFGLNAEDLLVQRHLVQMVVNFVKHGNPSLTDPSVVEWAPTSRKMPTRHLRITATPRMRRALGRDVQARFAFWQQITRKYGRFWCPTKGRRV